jgi:hypothetical protein
MNFNPVCYSNKDQIKEKNLMIKLFNQDIVTEKSTKFVRLPTKKYKK